ncbi:Spo0B domain-containing protein [Paenibacillus athensensis]|uniref:Sporulation initiation phosphotransferase B C-terminal domain-containing protein n=1 Tax=Paenibacillus athensensis TaxID=1967502 RepID=A0A4Y8PV41_9BACL|nr:Spo0B domain-containing protein [Paenibacillus athensensis]MCD1258219.1 Spo0B domain-containing protein [Paenibacillus athensensis]
MKRTSGVQVYLLAIVLIGWTGLFLLDAWPVRAALLIISAAAGWAAHRLELSRQREQADLDAMQREQQHHASILQVVNRLRHDWLNDLQLLFGYIQLKKYEQLQPFMEKLKVKIQQEGYVSKLGIPSLIAFLITFRVQSRSLQLEVGLDQEVNLQQLPVSAELISSLVRDTVELFREHSGSDLTGSGVLSLEFDAGDDHLLIDFVYQGSYEREALERAIHSRLSSSPAYGLETSDFQEEEAVIALRLPFHT